ncbi:MYND-type domain-containing protein [Mycena chlorophos]|uniref:MYND-type domain-containing protein n=1 Tax=Mycena chlorophos TaxID=658473 RepID=A0A8H6TPS3_MYCCL|nr:MYND-type domain-containing protein [Mycena chlorophos]
MHPCLDLALLENLPEPYKARTKAALASNGSMQRIRDIATGMSHMPKSRLPFLAPAFFTLLDPALQSSDRQLPHWQRVEGMPFLLLSLACLIDNGCLPLESFDDIWPRVWSWIQFLHSLCSSESPPPPPPLSEGLSVSHFYTRAAQCITSFRRKTVYQVKYERLITCTPGIYTFVGAAWTILLRPERFSDEGLSAISLLFSLDILNLTEDKLDPRRDAKMQDLVAGVGGTWEELASTVLKHVNLGIPSPDTDVGGRTSVSPDVGGMVALMRNAYDLYPEFRAALARNGIIRVLVTCIRAYNNGYEALQRRGFPYADLPEQFPPLLVGHLTTLRSHERIIEALQAGLLRLFVEFGAHCAIRNQSRVGMYFILQSLLPESSVFHSVLRQLRISMKEIGDVPPSHFRDSEFSTLWGNWTTLVKERLQVLERYEAGELASLRACDNLKCSLLLPNGQIKRCSGCQSAYYCSEECQRADYKTGAAAHRKLCPMLKSEREALDPEISAEDRTFLRALMNHEYETRFKTHLSMAFVATTSHLPDVERPIVFFDFSKGTCDLGVSHGVPLDMANDPTVRLEMLRRGSGGDADAAQGGRAPRDAFRRDQVTLRLGAACARLGLGLGIGGHDRDALDRDAAALVELRAARCAHASCSERPSAS